MTKTKVAWLLIIATVGLVGAALCRPTSPSWRDAPKPLQSAVQPSGQSGLQSGHNGAFEAPVTVLDGVAGCFQPGAVAVECLEGGARRCSHEDGDPSGIACWWVDRDGSVYYVSSSEYRP